MISSRCDIALKIFSVACLSTVTSANKEHESRNYFINKVFSCVCGILVLVKQGESKLHVLHCCTDRMAPITPTYMHR